MRFYAQRPVRFFRQLIADVVVVAWAVLVVIVAQAAYELVVRLQAPARALTDAGEAIRGAFDDAAGTAAGVPIVGEELARAFGTGTAAGASLADAGREQVATVAAIATWAAVGIVVLGAVPVVLLWLTLRLRYARSAAAARCAGTDLLALRAMARRPVRRLLAVSEDPAAAWRRDDRDVVHGLADLELRSLGLRATRQ
jgi:hypothetical protein